MTNLDRATADPAAAPLARPCRRRSAGSIAVGALVAALTTLGAGVARAQQPIDVLAPETYTVEVPFSPGAAQVDGHERASAFVEYRFRACGTGVFVAWRLLPERTEASSAYWYRGKRHDGGSLRPPVSVDFAADIISNGARIGSMRRLAQPSSSMDVCGRMTANSQRVGELGNWVQLPAGPASVSAFLQTLSLRASPTNARLRNPDAESAIAQRLAAEQRQATQPQAAQPQAVTPPATTQPATGAGSAVRAGTATVTSAGASTGTRTAASTAEQRADSASRARAAATLRSIEESNRRQAENEAKAEAIADGVVQVAGMVGQIRASRQAAKEREEARAAAAEAEKARRAAAEAAYDEEYIRAMAAQGDPDGYRRMLPFAERGYKNTESVIANMYLRGQGGVSQDVAEALRWYRRATENPSRTTRASAMESLAFLYTHGVGVAVDSSEALRWLRLAAEHGDPSAQVERTITADKFEVAMGRRPANMANSLFVRYLGAPDPQGGRNRTTRADFLRNAKEMGSSDAHYAEGVAELSSLDWYRKKKWDAEPTRMRAVEALTAAAEKGHMGAVARLRELGVPVTPPWDTTVIEASLRAYQKAFDAGRHGEALAMARKAAENGSALAAFLMGSMYREGQGTPRNLAEAFVWFYRSAAAGDREGRIALARAYTNGEGGVRHRAEAWRLLDSIAVAPKSVGAKVTSLRFFEVANGQLAPTGDEGFANSFSASSARSLGYVLELSMPPLKSETVMLIGCTIWSTKKRSSQLIKIGDYAQVFRLEPGTTTLRMASRPLAWDDRADAAYEEELLDLPRGVWGKDKYTVECGSVGAKGRFTVQ